MKAARVIKFKEPYEIQEIPLPECGDDYLVVKVMAAGYCHTDGMVANGEFEWAGSKCPVTGSHEAVGIVHQVGKNVKSFKAGDRVGALSLIGVCGTCPDCRADRPLFCDAPKGMYGLTTDGGFAEYVRVDPKMTVSLPADYEFLQAAPMMCAGVTIFNAIKLSGCGKGDVLGIIGLGALGHLGVQFCHALGIKVIAIDSRDEPLHMKLRYPPSLALNANIGGAKIVEEITKALGKNKDGYEGCDSVIVATGAVPAFATAFDILHKHGTLVMVGQPAESVPVVYRNFIFKDIRMIGSLLGERDVLQEALQVAANHGIRSSIQAYRLEQVNEMVKQSHSSSMCGKLVVDFS